ncbi:MAG: hypothetical protein WCC48_04390 [Anaeromyxobacteraceae bacterium]
MPARHFLALLVTLAALAAPRAAGASVNLGLGADWIEGGDGELNLTLGADTYLARHLSVGGRAGVAFFGDSSNVAVPLDLRLTVHVQRIYFEGLVGPWFLLDDHDLFRFHGAFGFGVESRSVAFGVEVGALRDATMLGLRLAFRM